MLPTLVPLEQSRAYQEIFAEGTAKGRAEGKADGLKRLLTRRFGAPGGRFGGLTRRRSSHSTAGGHL